MDAAAESDVAKRPRTHQYCSDALLGDGLGAAEVWSCCKLICEELLLGVRTAFMLTLARKKQGTQVLVHGIGPQIHLGAHPLWPVAVQPNRISKVGGGEECSRTFALGDRAAN